MGAHILSVDQFALADVERVFAAAERMEPFARRQRRTRVLEGAVLGNLFFEPSTRSRFSFGAAFERLGGSVRDMTGFEQSSIAKGESIHDTARVMSGYVDVVVVRHPDKGSVEEFAKASAAPVLNSGDGAGEHPTQALLDLYTICRETGRSLRELGGLKVAMVGDLRHGRTVHSLAKLLGLLPRVELRMVTPEALRMPEEIVRKVREMGHAVHETAQLAEGISGADIVYCTRLQLERHFDSFKSEWYGEYSIDRALFERHGLPNAVLLHPLPRDNRSATPEIANDLNGHPRMAAFRQAANGIPVRMALFMLIFGVEDQLEATAAPVTWHVPRR